MMNGKRTQGIKRTVKNTSETSISYQFFDRNSFINISVILISIGLAFFWSPLGLLAWPLTLLIDDILLVLFRFSIFDPEVSVQRGYQFPHVFLEKTSGHGRDLGFNLYDGDLKKDHHQAQIDKWEFMLNQLDLRKGDRLIDIGCGYGDWLNYAREKGLEVVGINISPEQTNFAKSEYGLDVICCNWKDILNNQQLQKKLFDRFDAVTFMDTIEHYVHYTKGWTKAAEITYGNVFYLASRLLRPESRTGRVFISCLHINPNVATYSISSIFKYNLKILLSTLLLIRTHSGCYPFGDDGLTKHSAPYFTEINRYDKSEDYRLTAVMDKNHFQAPKIKWTLSKILHIPLLFIVDPHHIYKWFDHYFDAWMNCYGKDNYELTYNSEKRRKTSFVTLWWIVLKHHLPGARVGTLTLISLTALRFLLDC